MILYGLAKQMEEHERLRRTIGATEGDTGALLRAKEELKQSMLQQANSWSTNSGYLNLDTSFSSPAVTEANEAANRLDS